MVSFKKGLLVSVFAITALSLFVLAATQLNSPSACSGQWTNCANAFGDNSNRATAQATGSANKTGTWQNYGFSIADSSAIDSVIVRADFFASKTSGRLDVRVSGDAGATWGPVHRVGGNTAEQTFNIDVTNDVAWSGSKLNNTNLRVEAKCVKVGGGANPTCNLDWLPLNVSYTPFDFSVSASPSSGSVTQGDGTTSNVTVTHLGGISQPVSLSVSGCPASATCTVNPNNGNPTYDSTLSISTSPITPAGTYIITVTGTGGGKTHNANYTLTVIEFDFSISLNPTSGSVTQGDSTNSNVTVTLLSGASRQVDLTVSGCPASATCTVNPNNGNPTYGSTLSISTSPVTPAGTYTITVTGTGGGKTHNANYTLTVIEFDFSVGVNPASGTVEQGQNATTTASVTLLSGSTRNVDLTHTGCPTGATCSFTPASGNPNYTSSFKVATTTSTPAGTYIITLTGTGGGKSRSVNYTLTVNEPFEFSMSATPSSNTVAQGQSVATTVEAALVSGPTQTVYLVYDICPPFALCTYSVPSGNPTFSSTFTVQTNFNGTTPVGTYNMLLSGYSVSPYKFRSTNYTLEVT